MWSQQRRTLPLRQLRPVRSSPAVQLADQRPANSTPHLRRQKLSHRGPCPDDWAERLRARTVLYEGSGVLLRHVGHLCRLDSQEVENPLEGSVRFVDEIAV